MPDLIGRTPTKEMESTENPTGEPQSTNATDETRPSQEATGEVNASQKTTVTGEVNPSLCDTNSSNNASIVTGMNEVTERGMPDRVKTRSMSASNLALQLPIPPVDVYTGNQSSHKRERSATRRQATECVKSIDKLLNKDESSFSLDDSDVLSFHIEKATRVLDSLLAIKSHGEVDPPSTHLEDIQLSLHRAKRRLARVDMRNDPRLVQPGPPPPPQPPPSIPTHLKKPHLDVGRIQLPKFNGNPDEWQRFWSLFTISVHESDYYQTIEKFAQLLSHLEGAALKVVDGLPLTEANYQVARDLLSRRYGILENRRDIILTRLQSLPNLPSSLKPDVFNGFVDTALSCIRELETLNVSVDHHALFSLPAIERKLPPWMRERWVRLKSSEETPGNQFTRLVMFLQDESKILVHCQKLSTQDNPPRGERAPWKSQISNPNHVKHNPNHTLVITSQQNNEAPHTNVTPVTGELANPSQGLCPACKGKPHKFSDCSKFLEMDAKQRYTVIKEASRCTRCLGRRHRHFSDCRGRSCTNCRGNHHRYLCLKQTDSNVQPPAPSLQVNEDINPVPAIIVPPCQPPEDTNCVFLKICTARIYSPSCPAGEWINVYLDDGARHSYIVEDLAERLGLPILSKRDAWTGGFGGVITKLPASNVVSFQLSNRVGSPPVQLSARTAPKICVPIRQENPVVFPQEMVDYQPLADVYDGGERHISILIGADHIWKVTGVHHRPPNCPVILDTYFGFVPTGSAPFRNKPYSFGPSPSLLVSPADPQHMWALDIIAEESSEPELPKRSPLDPKRYEVPLPFKDNRRPECNFTQASIRHSRSLQSLTKNPEKLAAYDKKIAELLAQHVTERAKSPRTIGFYLHHHAVWKKNKIRIVHDGSARDPNGVSFNSLLDTGPNLLLPLLDVLMNARLYQHVLASDVKAAFLQVGIRDEDRQWLKFIWRDVEYQFARVAFGLSCSPYLLHSTPRAHILQNAPKQLHDVLLNALYVDDLTLCGPNLNELQDIQKAAQSLFLDASMELIPVPSPTKILGVGWLTPQDQLFVRNEVTTPSKLTRRTLLAFISSFFDPLGILTPWTLEGRHLFQQSWMEPRSWDASLPNELISKFNRVASDLELVESIHISRCLHWSPGTTELHLFCDASSKAYAFVVYSRNSGQNSGFVYSKSRLAPLRQKLTIPQLELMATVLAFRFFHHFVAHFGKPSRSILWSDSSCVLSWLKNGTSLRRQPFVSNRLAQIALLTQPTAMRYVPTELNPADLPSRGCDLKSLLSSSFHVGPKFLNEPETSWPSSPHPPPELLVSDEMEPLDTPGDSDEPIGLIKLLPLENYSTMTRLLRVGSFVRRFWHNSRLPSEQRNLNHFLTAEERQNTFTELLKCEQERLFPKEIERLRSGLPLNKSSSLARLRPILSGDVLCLLPRTNEGPLPILPRRSRLTDLVVTHFHALFLHQGASITLNEIRRHYWIPGGRSLVKRLVFHCHSCKRFRALPYQTPEGFLAPHRRSAAIPWSITGMDFFGPMYISDGGPSNDTKVYCLLLTCGVVRAVHLELTPSLTAKDTRFAIKRFLNVRVPLGHHVTFYSDNAKTFLQLSGSRISTTNPSDWRFIPARSPHWGGWWERLIRWIKHSLRIIIRNRKLSFAELQAHLGDISAVMNARPLCQVSPDPSDTSAITPNHFLLPLCPMDSQLDPAVIDDAILRGILQKRDALAREFWTRWQTEYLASLRQWTRLPVQPRLPIVGDLVLVKELSPRSTWPLARVTRIVSGKDGIPRMVELLLRGKITTRSCHLLYPLEAGSY